MPARRLLVILFLVSFLAGCSGLVTRPLSEGLHAGVVDQRDPATVAEGLPAYILLVDGLIRQNPESPELLSSGARLNALYASTFAEAPERARILASKARDYGRRRACLAEEAFCAQGRQPFADFRAAVDDHGGDAEPLYAYATGWAAWLQAHSEEMAALGDIPRVEVLLERVLAMEPNHDRGMPHLYLGMLKSRLPAAMGGQPEAAREHFLRALELSDGENLAAKVAHARDYARLRFDRDLHDRLLGEVLAADPRAEGFTLSNKLAQAEARRLLESADDYF